MPGITIKRQIAAPRERVFASATDFRRAAEIVRKIKRVEVLTDGPIRVGTRFRETREMFGRECTEEMEVVAFDPPHGFALGCENHGSRYRSEFRLTPSGSGTELEMRFQATPLTLVAKILSVVFLPMMRFMAKECAKDFDDIAAEAETQPAAGRIADATSRSRTA